MTRPTIFIAGLGDLGAVLLELLARERWPGRVVAGSRDLARTSARVNLASLGAMAQGCRPTLEAVRLDLDDEAGTAELLHHLAPDIILATAARQSWWTPERLPPVPRARLAVAGFGVWLPIHLVLSLKLMRAVQASGSRARVLIAPFPDVANCVLSRLGLEPAAGVGNLDEIVPKIAALAAARLDVAVDDVEISLVAHHALEAHVFEANASPMPPYHLRIVHAGTDVTQAVDGHSLLRQPYPLPPGPAIHFLTAGSAVRLMRALTEADTRLHAPGPEGLPGGYPVIAGPDGVRVAPIDGLSRTAAIEINERSHAFDGIAAIEADGTVAFTPESTDALARELGYHCDRLPPAEIAPRADELLKRFQAYAARHDADIG
ncbi:MAG: hypothetical protein QGF21_09840 [Vicinamibacterales bacterium]|jgi:hypothetical protein|nr:hypothetical protein [Acidobacteriota bacterium]MDP7471083.1 hypothetical protein [Vicinamibacterales bacterium]MDP7672230.1 hypothetical protein [Vicinamibacterales bacterium]HJO37651.1 hypothetical protein [Vicinamibacterales bacterium]